MIEVNNLTEFKISEGFFKKLAEDVFKKEKTQLDLSVALVESKEIKALNRQYRKKDKPTDVLSFSYGNSGEVVICPGVVEANAKKYQAVFKKELARVLIHGLLHILGYNHQTMASRQIRYLKLFLK